MPTVAPSLVIAMTPLQFRIRPGPCDPWLDEEQPRRESFLGQRSDQASTKTATLLLE